MNSSRGNLTEETINSYVYLFRSMWNLRDSYPASLQVNAVEIAELSAAFKSSLPSVRWKPIDLGQAQALLSDAMNWMETIAPSVIQMAHQLYSTRKKFIGKSKLYRRRLSKDTYSQIVKTNAYELLASKIGSTDEESYRVLRSGVFMTVSAAITIILLLTGMRISELVSLKRGCTTKNLLNDGHSYSYINGIAAKKNGKEKAWIAPKPVIDAVAIIESLFEGPARNTTTKYLFLSFSGNGALPVSTTRVHRMNQTIAARWFREFAVAKWRDKPYLSERQLHPHQARKTFARFVVKRDKRALGALAQHYGHIYLSVLDDAYIGTDIELSYLLEEETRQELIAGLTDILKSKNLAGKAANNIEKFKEKTFGTVFPGKRALEKIVNQLLDDGVVLAPCNWGYCLYAADMSACRGDQTGPNEIRRCPSTCSGCSNFLVSDTHRSWWEARYREDEAFLKRKNISPQVRMVVEKKLEESAQIIGDINRSVSPTRGLNDQSY
jgi:integrase